MTIEAAPDIHFTNNNLDNRRKISTILSRIRSCPHLLVYNHGITTPNKKIITFHFERKLVSAHNDTIRTDNMISWIFTMKIHYKSIHLEAAVLGAAAIWEPARVVTVNGTAVQREPRYSVPPRWPPVAFPYSARLGNPGNGITACIGMLLYVSSDRQWPRFHYHRSHRLLCYAIRGSELSRAVTFQLLGIKWMYTI